MLKTQGPIVVDCFAGGGGASMGIEQALGRPVDVAINHDRLAVAMHEANHPSTKHYTQDVWLVDPVAVAAGREVELAWFSPDCTHFSKAKGGKPRAKNIRDLAWVVVEWAKAVRPKVIMLENVEEFAGWGPLDNEGYPIRERKGETFAEWVAALRDLGYEVEWRELRACDYGAPTIRKRLFLIARCDGRAIKWPRATHGKGFGMEPYHTAAECIDWTIPVPSIFDRKKALAHATERRIAFGLKRFVLEAAEPFIIHLTHHGAERVRPVTDPFSTITAAHRGEQALVAPYVTKFQQNSFGQRPDEPIDTIMAGATRFGLAAATLIQTGQGERDGQLPRVPGLDKPIGTIVAGGGRHALVAAFMAKHFGGHQTPGASLSNPIDTITAVDHHALVAAHLTQFNGTNRGGVDIDAPLPTVTGQGEHFGLAQAFLDHYNGSQKQGQSLDEAFRTMTSKDRFGLVMIYGELYQIVDIGMRMLVPRELFLGNGFPPGYIIAPMVDWLRQEDGTIVRRKKPVPMPLTEQIRMCGNSVPPGVAKALVAANVGFDHQAELFRGYELAAAVGAGR